MIRIRTQGTWAKRCLLLVASVGLSLGGAACGDDESSSNSNTPPKKKARKKAAAKQAGKGGGAFTYPKVDSTLR